PRWSPDGQRYAFLMHKTDGIELWVGHVKTMRVRALTEAKINSAGGASFVWMTDSQHILCRMIPHDRGDRPEPPVLPKGPVVEENDGRISPVRTYQDLLSNPHDENLFDWVMTSHLMMLDCNSSQRRRIGEPGIYTRFDPAPDGKHLLVSSLHRPYSYRVTARSFPTTLEVWDTNGNLVQHIADLPLRDTTPIGGVATGPRRHQWSAREDSARLLWIEALDGGDPKTKVEHRDRLMWVDAPYDGEPVEEIKLEHRYSGLAWVDRSNYILITEFDRDRRWTRTWRHNFGTTTESPRVVFDRSVNDRYGDPGRPQTRTNASGRSVVIMQNGNLYLSGAGASPQGDRPFLNRMNLLTLVTDRLWQSRDGRYETIVAMRPDSSDVIYRSESPEEPPNYFLLDLKNDHRTQLTAFEDPTPQMRGIHKELVTYARDDGVNLSATLYLPAEYEKGQRLPLIVWAYPREFNNARTAGQVRGSPYRFTRVGGTSHLFFLTQGYAIMDSATMPVIGDPETMNDSFLDQIVSSADAAIKFASDRGVADLNRVGVGGHSYGAFMTANLLAHCDLFDAGIARSGAYNRTLTPFGFQSERRTLWEAPMSYFRISPFMHADKINEPILLIHGQMDNNSGTFPVQSQRMYHALKGHGATVRLVMLPYESHGYRAKESVLHVMAEMIDWFDIHVKHAGVHNYDPGDQDATQP
ncbi:MAG: prolyl oligopeptidase family serine peptidase, partial [Planctomycetota bacterium]|nr:prolyl oligopeptidase family serine peptidase [Planctomycetota bacterium]